MKLFAICLMILSVAKGCEQTDKKPADAKAAQRIEVVYTANSRGFYQKITVKDHSLFVANSRDEKGDGTLKHVTDAQWESLFTKMEKIDPEILPTLKAPTEKRFYDGAAIANLKVTYNGKEYMTTDFDHGNPPAEIEEVVNIITFLAK